MRRHVCSSTGCMYAPIPGRKYILRDKINKVIKLWSKLDIDGVEILFGDARKLIKSKFNKSSIKILKDLPFNTLHFPFKVDEEKLLVKNDAFTKKVLKKIYEICDKINVQSINIHQQQIKNFKVLNKYYNYTIENMEMHHGFNVKYYKDIMKKHNFKFVLDTTHAGESGEIDKLYKAFKKDISYTHLSANYFNHLHIPFHAMNKEYLKPFSVVKKKKFPIILESQIGVKDINEYKQEVDFVRKWLK